MPTSVASRGKRRGLVGWTVLLGADRYQGAPEGNLTAGERSNKTSLVEAPFMTPDYTR